MITEARFEAEKQQEVERQRRLEEAKNRAKRGAKHQHVSQDSVHNEEKLEQRPFHGQMWAQKPEEILRGEERDELALQEDFVPL